MNVFTPKASTWVVLLTGLSLGSFQNIRNDIQLHTRVSGIKQKGKIMIGLYNKAAGFGEDSKTFKSCMVDPAGRAEVTVSFDELPPGEYAIALYQDINNNGKLDAGLFGKPKEPYAFSRNVKPRFSAPHFDDCKFQIQSVVRQDIVLINP